MIFRLFILIILLIFTDPIGGKETEDIDNSVESTTMKQIKSDRKPFMPSKNPDVEQIEITSSPGMTEGTQSMSTMTTTMVPRTTTTVKVSQTIESRSGAQQVPESAQQKEKPSGSSDKKKECIDCWDRPWAYDWTHPQDWWNKQRRNYPPSEKYRPFHYTYPHYNWNAGPALHRYGSHWPNYKYNGYWPKDIPPYVPKDAFPPPYLPKGYVAPPYLPGDIPPPYLPGDIPPPYWPGYHPDWDKHYPYWPKDGSYRPTFNGHAWW